MKKIISLLLSILMVVSLVPMFASAATESWLMFGYVLSDTGKTHGGTKDYHAVITARHALYTGSDITIPKTLPIGGIDYPVYFIKDGAFRNDILIKTLRLGDVLHIGDEAFKNSTLENVPTLKSSVKIIGKQAFKNTKIDEISLISSSDIEVCSEAFADCDNLTTIYLSNRIKSIASDAFKGSDNIKKIIFTGNEAEWAALNLNFENVEITYNECTSYFGHSFKKYSTEKYATCSTKGIDINQCENCYYRTKVETAYDKSNHNANITYTTIKAATCTETGIGYRTCKCGYTPGEYVISALGHDVGSSGTRTYATCTTDGVRIGTCIRCKNEINEVVEKAYGHKFYSYSSECKNSGCDFVCTDHPGNDDNLDGKCDLCGNNYAKNCTHLCHKGGFWYAICLFFWKLFKMNKTCECGMRHYK